MKTFLPMEREGIFLRLDREEGNALPERFIEALMLPAFSEVAACLPDK